jgi:hypothetical protein
MHRTWTRLEGHARWPPAARALIPRSRPECSGRLPEANGPSLLLRDSRRLHYRRGQWPMVIHRVNPALLDLQRQRIAISHWCILSSRFADAGRDGIHQENGIACRELLCGI